MGHYDVSIVCVCRPGALVNFYFVLHGFFNQPTSLDIGRICTRPAGEYLLNKKAQRSAIGRPEFVSGLHPISYPEFCHMAHKNPRPSKAASLLPQNSLLLTFECAARILPDIHQQLAKMAPAAAPASDVQQMHLWALSPREMTQLERGLW